MPPDQRRNRKHSAKNQVPIRARGPEIMFASLAWVIVKVMLILSIGGWERNIYEQNDHFHVVNCDHTQSVLPTNDSLPVKFYFPASQSWEWGAPCGYQSGSLVKVKPQPGLNWFKNYINSGSTIDSSFCLNGLSSFLEGAPRGAIKRKVSRSRLVTQPRAPVEGWRTWNQSLVSPIFCT